MKKNPKIQFSIYGGKNLVIDCPSTDSDFEEIRKPIRYDVFDMSGRKLMSGEFAGHATVELSHLSGGIYLFRIMRGNTLLSTEKIVLPN